MAEDDDAPPFPGGVGGTGGSGSPDGSPAPSFGTNLWIEILQVTNSQAFLRLHNTVSNELYQLQSKTNLVPGNNRFWIPGEIITATDTNVDFSPVDATPPNQFFRGQHGTEVVGVVGEVDAIRPDLPRDPGQNGGINADYFDSTDGFPGVTIFYRMSGSATQGVDYQTMPGTTNVNPPHTVIAIVPSNSTSIQFEEQIILTLIPTNTYLIQSNDASAVIGLDDNLTNSYFQLVTTSLTNPAGMAYHPLSNWVIVSYNSYASSPTNNFARIDTNGAIANWTGITGLVDEIKLAIAQTNEGGFNEGDMYFGSGTNGVIGRLSAAGTVSNLDWLTLPG